MDISTLIKVIAAVGAILTAAKVIHEFSLGGHPRRNLGNGSEEAPLDHPGAPRPALNTASN